VARDIVKPSLLNLSVEEENLAAIPFAVLERRVGKKLDKLEVRGTKVLPDGTELEVLWQVQGDNDLGLPTEQDLDIFVALGVLTFRGNFEKTIVFTGREIAKILNTNVHGKFYQRLKLAMGRLIALRFRAVASNERQEHVKWVNVFQETSFALDRDSGRCTGTVTWTDKIINSMGSGFFRLLDASRYMELDGITAKHLYRFLTVAFEKTDTIFIDARKLATEHLGILTPPQYLSRLMQTLEPAFEQLIRVEVLGGYHVASAEEWRIALRRHPAYVPERKALLLEAPGKDPETLRAHCQRQLEQGGLATRVAAAYCSSAETHADFYGFDRAGRLLRGMIDNGVISHVAVSVVRRALDLLSMNAEVPKLEARETLDLIEIALDVCEQKKRSRENLKNAGGLLIKLIKDPEARKRMVGEGTEESLKENYRRREEASRRQRHEEEERELILEYEQFRESMATHIFAELTDARKATLRQEKAALFSHQERFLRLGEEAQQREIEQAILLDLARQEVAPFEKWRLRRRAQQAVLPFIEETAQWAKA